jgi:hypothetical protein
MEEVPHQIALKKEIAREMRETFEIISPYIDKHTSGVCHVCREVCCTDRHGIYDGDDLLFLSTLGIKIPMDEDEHNTEDPCRYITKNGCKLERWMRPFRCTFFFCDALLKSLESDNAKLYRAFISYFNHLVSLRQRLIEAE